MRLFPYVLVRPAVVVGGVQAQSSADSAAVRATALDYVEGWYEGNAERMARALHPELVKQIAVHVDGRRVIVNVLWERKPKSSRP